MPDKKPATVSLTVDARTGNFLLTVPDGFDFVGPEADMVIAMLPTVPAQRHGAA